MIVTLPPAITSSLIDEISSVVPVQRQLWRFCMEHVLGTRLEMLVHSYSYASARFAAQVARTEIERLNRILNHRRNDSEISQLLRARRSTVSADLFSVLQLSEMWRHISNGAFDGRLGALLALWTTEAEPARPLIDQALMTARGSTIALDPVSRQVELSSAATLSLDALAKGYIVDAALDAARRAAPTLQGMAINVGGDIRCWGQAPSACGWRIGISNPAMPTENAPLVDAVAVGNAAIATSGLGPRDRIRNGYRSTTISPFTGCPVRRVISASVVASHAADADAIATACMVLEPDQSIALVDRLDGVAARITTADGGVHRSARWPTFQLTGATSEQATPKQIPPKPPTPPPELRWPADWELRVDYTAFQQEHEPYIAVWITDAQDKLVTTLFMLGKDPKWARENFIWWNSIGDNAKHLIEMRSQSTVRSGQYEMSWVGVDDNINPVPIGKYVLHFETNQELGNHTYHTMPVEIGRERFKKSFRDLNGLGELEISYGAYNDRFGP